MAYRAFHGQIEAILPESVWFKIKGLGDGRIGIGSSQSPRGLGRTAPALRVSVRRPSSLPLRFGIGLPGACIVAYAAFHVDRPAPDEKQNGFNPTMKGSDA